MKKILLGLCALSAVSFAAVNQVDKNAAVELTISGVVSITNDVVIPATKIVVYKEGATQGTEGVTFNTKVQKGQQITKEKTLNEFNVKEVPATGMTEAEIIASTNTAVAMDKIKVGYSKTGTPTVNSALSATNPIHWTIGSEYTGGHFGATLALKSKYDQPTKRVQVYLEGPAGATAGDVTMAGKFGIKVVS